MSRFIAALAVASAGLSYCGSAEAKMPGHEYCFHHTCHTVKTLDETRRLLGVTTTLKASYYDSSARDRYNPSDLTSSGERFHADRPDNAASPIYPDGTTLLVWHPASGRALVVRVNNAGPYWGDRLLDLSRAAAERFGFTRRGVTTVKVQVIDAPSQAEATYRKNRVYPPVKGYLGQFASLETALGGAGAGTTMVAEANPPVTTPAAVAVAAAAPVARPAVVAVAEAAPRASLAPPSMAVPTMVRAAVYPHGRSVAAAAWTHAPSTWLDLKVLRIADTEARKYLVASR